MGGWWGYKKGTAVRFVVDDTGSDELDKAFADLLTTVERVRMEAADRVADSGDKPRPVLYAEDREARRVAIVPLDSP